MTLEALQKIYIIEIIDSKSIGVRYESDGAFLPG